jgi:copper transport protein
VRRALLLAAAVAALALPATAGAHARLLGSAPANGAVLQAPPRAVVVRFDDVVVAGPGNAAVDAAGTSVLAGPARAHGRVLSVPLRRIGDGSYTVRWSVISDDGHNETGIVAFAVGAGATPHATLQAGGGGPPADDVLERLLLVGGILLGAGASAFALLVLRTRAVRLLAAVGFALAVAGGALEWARAPAGTRFEHGMAAVTIAAAVGGALSLAPRRAFAPLPCLAALAAIVGTSVGGHALDAGVPHVQVAVDVVHLAAASVWIGGLAALAVTLPTPALAVRRFSRLALGSVAVLAATGVLRALSEVSSARQLVSTDYGRLLVAKTAIFVLLLALAYLARSRLLARARALRRSVSVELALGVALVVAVALLTSVAPAKIAAERPEAPARTVPGRAPAPPPGSVTLAQGVGSLAVAVAVSAGSPRPVRVTVVRGDGNGADGLDVRVDGSATASCGHGCYAASVDAGDVLRVRVGGRSTTFRLPPPATAGGPARLALIERRYLRARTIAFHERLSSGPGQTITSRWRLASPSKLAFEASDGSSGVIIGGRRWDRERGGRWVESVQSPTIPQPQLPWPRTPSNVASLGRAVVAGKRVDRLSFVDPATPAWYTIAADARTHALVRVSMVAPAHFMRDDYTGLDVPVTIRPPTR